MGLCAWQAGGLQGCNRLQMQMNSSDASLVVFARLPVPGKVKTRLAASVGHEAACSFYKACAEHIIQVACSTPGLRPSVHHSCGDDTAAVKEWVVGGTHHDVEVRPQTPAPDLGDKMHYAMSESQPSCAGHAKVIVIGTDIPDITQQLLTRAVHALDAHELVVGPAKDGGYYLLGLTNVEKSLFQGIEWSTPTVLADTLKRAAAAGLIVAPLDTLPTLQDIDTVQDLQAWLSEGGQLGEAGQGRHEVQVPLSTEPGRHGDRPAAAGHQPDEPAREPGNPAELCVRYRALQAKALQLCGGR